MDALTSPSPAHHTISIEDILRTNAVVTHFQPILSARQKSIVGFEALARGVNLAQVIEPSSLFGMATGPGQPEQLQRLCHRDALRAFARLAERSPDLLVFLNLAMPASDEPDDVADVLLDLAAGAGLLPSSVAVEILEAQIADMMGLRDLVGRLRSHGFLIVLDDVGAGHSNLDRISLIRPDILKIDRSLIRRVNADFHKQSTVKSLVDLSRKTGALVVAEGVETEDEAIACLELGADLLQGYFLGRPQAAELMEPLSQAFDRIEAVARTFKSYMVGKINSRKMEHRRFNVVLNEILCDLTGNDVHQFDQILSKSIGRYPNVECVYVLDHSGIQVTDTVCHPNMRRRQDGAIFRPAPRGADHSLKEYYYILLDVELHKYTTDPYVSLASGNVSRTISTYFRDAKNTKMYVLCVDVLCD